MSGSEETDEEFIARVRSISTDWRYSAEFIGQLIRGRWPADYNFTHAGIAEEGR